MKYDQSSTAPTNPVFLTNLSWLRVCIGIAAAGYLSIVGTRLFVFHEYSVAAWMEAMTGLACVAAFVTFRQWPRAAGLFVIAILWCELTYTLYGTAATEVTSILVFPVLIITLGLLFGERWAVGGAFAAGLTIPLAIFTGRRAQALATDPTATIISVVVVEIVLVCITLFARVILTAFRDLLDKSEGLRQRYTRLFHATPDGLLEIDQAGRIAEANTAAERLFGAGREQLLGQSLDDVLARGNFTPALVPGEIRPDLPVVLHAGPNRYEVIAGVAPDANGAALLVVRDVTKRHQVMEKQALSQRLETVGQLAGGIAHEFNNLLTTIGGNASLIKFHSDTDVQRFAGEIIEAQQRAATLTRQMLAFARHDLHQPEVISLGRELAEWGELLRHLAGEHCRLEIKGGGASWVRADPVQIEQILGNLVNNARDASPKDGLIELRLARMNRADAQALGSTLEAATQVVLEVADQGPGMTPEVTSHLFEPFFTTKPLGQGTGLGLAAVHGLVAQNGGAVEIESRPGRGTVARIFFPEAPAPSGAVTGSGSPVPAAAPLGHVLLVDDDASACRTAVLALEQGGYEVTVIANGFEAVKFLRQATPAVDLVIASVTLPVLGGPELVERLRQLRAGLPALYVCGRFAVPTDWPADEALLLKPFRAEELLGRVGAALSRDLKPET